MRGDDGMDGDVGETARLELVAALLELAAGSGLAAHDACQSLLAAGIRYAHDAGLQPEAVLINFTRMVVPLLGDEAGPERVLALLVRAVEYAMGAAVTPAARARASARLEAALLPSEFKDKGPKH